MTNDHSANSEAPSRWLLMAFLVAISLAAVIIKLTTSAEVGSVADWVAALGALAALVAAFAAARFAADVVRIERDRDDERDRTARMAQASLVSAWAEVEQQGRVNIKWTSSSPEPDMVTRAPIVPVSVLATVLNASSVPIWHFALVLFVPPLEPGGRRIEIGQHRVERALQPGLLGPFEALDADLSAEFTRVMATYPNAEVEPVQIQIGWRFTDNVGRRWYGAPGEPLTEIRTLD